MVKVQEIKAKDTAQANALLIGLPLALNLEGEAKIMAQEREHEGQREGQAVLANPGLYPQAIPKQSPALPLRADLYRQASSLIDFDWINRFGILPSSRLPNVLDDCSRHA
ncbi:hypothetical protein FRC00_003486 [Tulasnella sp. 408]|nr:hypothetical protein FRC00_003486 [Tulasnella sp. 408]